MIFGFIFCIKILKFSGIMILLIDLFDIYIIILLIDFFINMVKKRHASIKYNKLVLIIKIKIYIILLIDFFI
jgi:hypothetical protein